jgi:hypothetical protein
LRDRINNENILFNNNPEHFARRCALPACIADSLYLRLVRRLGQ